MTEQERNESTIGQEERQKDVPIRSSASLSRHIVDLTSFSRRAPKGPRPALDFWQRLHVWLSRFRRAKDDPRAIVPFQPDKKPFRASFTGFLSLPFAIFSLAFKPRVRPAKAPKSPAPTSPVVIKLSKKTKPAFSFFPDASWKRHVIAFAVIALIITLPLQALLSYSGLLKRAGVIAADAQEAVGGLKDAGKDALASPMTAKASFDRSAGAFAATRDHVDDIAVRLAALLTGNGEKLSSGSKLLAAGEDISKAGAELADGLDAMEKSQDTNAKKLARMSEALKAAMPRLEDGVAQLDGVSPHSLPASYRAPFEQIRADVKSALEDLRRTSDASATLLDAIGANGMRRYLVVFENSRELRPTGGFIGSYALMDLEDGAIKKIEIPAGGSYDLRGGFNQRVAAPEQLRLVNTRWEFQDANWFADFPTSAKSLMWFYEKSGGPTVDGVIAVTSNVMEDLLRAVGPIDLPAEGKTISADNFMDETQKTVEITYDHETNQPKQIISDMAPKVLQKLVENGSSDLPALSGALGNALASKDVQVYFNDANAQASAQAFGWTGELRPIANADYLDVVDTNIAGGKTDGVVDEDIRHETSVDADGSLIDTVSVTRSHHGKTGELFTGIKNIDYQRFYVPKGSVLLSAEGFEAPGAGYFQPADDTLQPSTLLAAVEGDGAKDPTSGTDIHDESELTVFGNWIQVAPGEIKTVRLRYRLPFRLQDLEKQPSSWLDRAEATLGLSVPTAEMKLVVQKQPGATHRTFESRITPPADWQIRSSVPQEALATPAGLTLKTPLDHDLYVGLVLVNHQ